MWKEERKEGRKEGYLNDFYEKGEEKSPKFQYSALQAIRPFLFGWFYTINFKEWLLKYI